MTIYAIFNNLYNCILKLNYFDLRSTILVHVSRKLVSFYNVKIFEKLSTQLKIIIKNILLWIIIQIVHVEDLIINLRTIGNESIDVIKQKNSLIFVTLI